MEYKTVNEARIAGFKKGKRIYEKKEWNRAMHIMECPECKSIEASASERMSLPEFTTCSDPNCPH